jgi:DNA-binding NtrC family response regulator
MGLAIQELKQGEGGSKVNSEIHAVLISRPKSDVFGKLKQVLERQGIATSVARTYEEARAQFKRDDHPHVVFTDTETPRGTWADVVEASAEEHVPVIVVSRLVDLNLYIEVLEKGATDFVVPPFHAADLAYIVRNAASHAWMHVN